MNLCRAFVQGWIASSFYDIMIVYLVIFILHELGNKYMAFYRVLYGFIKVFEKFALGQNNNIFSMSLDGQLRSLPFQQVSHVLKPRIP